VTQAEDRSAATLCEAFQVSVARVPERVALRTPGDAVCLSWAEYGAAVERMTGSLATAGLARGDRVAFFSRNRPELAICEVAALHLGAAGVALYATSSPATLEHVLQDSEPSVLLVESELAPRLANVHHGVANVLALDAGPCEHRELASLAQPEDFDFGARWRAVQEEDLAALIYTSGTTSLAKGVEWRHLTALGCMRSFDATCGERDGICDVSFAPFAHLSERFGGHWHALTRGSTRTVCADPAQLGVALRDARPTRLGGSPQVWQRLQLGLLATLDESERAVLDAAREHVGARTQTHNGGGEVLDAPTPSDPREATLAALRARIGLDRTVLAVSTAAPCPPAVHEHYRALGMPLREMFAMTETGVGAGQREGSLDHGTLGPALPGYELRIAPDGEVLVSSPTAPRAYRNRMRENAEIFGEDGWIHTGDLGELDTEGRLRLIGRKKEMLIPEHGVNVAPARIESALSDACPTIVQVCVLGDGRPRLAALITIEPATATEETQRRAAVANAVGEVNETLGPYEQVEAHAVLTDAWLPGAELTETLKLRRAHILERYATTIEELYRQ
jgi:long-chain acyl-CoA synthetase